MISVIVPIYNSEKYIHQCVDSLINQTYREIEIILVDDGSTDSSGLICDDYALKDPRVRVIHQRNARIAAARNAGIDIAKGDYITFIDSDDYILPDTYSSALELMNKYGADMVQWDLQYLTESGFQNSVNDSNKTESEHVDFVTSNMGAIKIMLDTHHPDNRFNNICQCCNCVWPKLFKRELFDNIRFPLGKEYEDLRIVHKLYFNANNVVFTNKRFSVYRLRNDSVVHSMSPKGTIDGVEAFEDKYRMLKECNLSECEQLLPMAAHNFLASMVTAYPAVKGKREKSDLKRIVKKNRDIREDLKSVSDQLVFFLLNVSPSVAFRCVDLRRKVRKQKKNR